MAPENNRNHSISMFRDWNVLFVCPVPYSLIAGHAQRDNNNTVLGLCDARPSSETVLLANTDN